MRRLTGPLAGHRHLLRGTFGMLGALLMQALGGFLFWLVAARMTDATAIGRAGALISSASFVIYATNFGMGALVSRFAAREAPQDHLRFALASVITLVTTCVGAVVYWAALVRGTPVGSGAGVLAAFVLGSAALSLAPLLDVRLTGLRRMGLLLGRSALVVVAKLLLLLVLASYGGVGVFLAAVLPDAAIVVVVMVFATARWLRERGDGVRLEDRQQLTHFASFAYLSQLAMSAPIMVLPVIVLVRVPAETNGSFFVAWSIASVVFLLPVAAMLALQIEGGREGADVARQFRLAVRLVVSITAAAFAGSFLLAPFIPVLYGPDFTESARLLPWLVAGCIPWSVVALCISDARVRDRRWLSIRIGASVSLACLPLASVLTIGYGVDGTVTAWCVGTVVGSIVALLLRRADLARWPVPVQA